ncbi:hypothetical protein [Baekduia sp. Peel2402]|uniref:hypothetical protein n=1 Tax=Baekduia sp. Peel2402 TaxID=3458296 RepID=UPI00403ECA1F
MSADADADFAARRAAFEDECLRGVRKVLADEAPLRGEMERHGRTLRSLTLERSDGDAEVVAEMVLADGTPLTERYSVWHFDVPPNLDEPFAAREAAKMIAIAITDL